MAISGISKSLLVERLGWVNREIENIDRELSPLQAQKAKLDDRINALLNRKADLISNKTEITKDTQ